MGMSAVNEESLYAKVSWLNEQYKVARYNTVLYGKLLNRAKKYSFTVETILAVSAPGTLGTLILVNEQQWLTIMLACIASTVALLKPILSINDKIERYTRLHNTYNEITCELEFLIGKVRVDGDFSGALGLRFDMQMERMIKLSELDDPWFREKDKKNSYKQVLKEIPAGHLWIPRVKED